MTYPPVVVVNSYDEVIGSAPLAEVWEKGLTHRVVYVIVEDGQGKVMLHRRSDGMRLFPGRWDTAGGHVDVTPDYEESAKIELLEEAGVAGQPLEEVAYLYSESPYDKVERPRRFVKIFRVRCSNEVSEPDRHEVAAIRWFTKEELKELANTDPDKIAMCLRACLPYIIDGYEDNEHQAAGQAHRPLLNIR